MLLVLTSFSKAENRLLLWYKRAVIGSPFSMSHFKNIAERKPIISFLFLEMLSDVLEENKEATVYEAISSAWGRSNGGASISDEDCLQIARRLSDKRAADEASTEDTSPGRKQKGPGMGTTEMEWLAGLMPDKLCMYVANYSPDLSVKLYCEYDYEFVAELAAAKQNNRWHEVRSSFETSMYGFGGSYKGDRSAETSDGKVIDVDSSDKDIDGEALKAIKSMGF